MKYFAVLLFLVLNVFYLFCQQAEPVNNVPEKYSRNALSVIILEPNNEYANDIVSGSSGIIIPDKFDDNNLEFRNLKAPSDQTAILNQLVEEYVVNQILEKWFSRNPETGAFNMSVIHQRGLYNATDDEVLKASASKIGLANLKDAGESLINQSYIFVLEFDGIKSMRQVYNQRDVAKKATAELLNKNYEPVKRVKNGWVGDVKGYLCKINFNDSILDVFYNDLWIYEDDDDATKAHKKELFNKTKFPLEFVALVQGSADGSQYNSNHVMAPPVQLTRAQLFQKMINSGLASCVDKSEKLIADFQVNAPVYKIRPISAKIGKKEGLKTDQRYFVSETRQNRNGDMVLKRKAVVRVNKAVDNREVATGNSQSYSTFYQIAGRGVSSGMLLSQKNDFGIGVSGGVTMGEIGGGWGKLEFNVARLASGIGDVGISQLKVFGYLGFQNKGYDVLHQGTVYDMQFIRWQAGISKGFYFARRFSLAPFVAFGAESGSNTQMNADFNLKSNDFIGADYFNYGISGNMNLLHFLQLYACVNYILPFPYTYTKQRTIFDYGVFNNKKYTEVFNDRKGLSIDFGIRLEF